MSVRGLVSRALRTMEGASERRQRFSLTRRARARSWLSESSKRCLFPLAFASGSTPSVSWRPGWNRFGGARGATSKRQRSERREQGSSSRRGAVGQLLEDARQRPPPRTSLSLSPKLARANISATWRGPSQRELCGPLRRNPHEVRSCRWRVCKHAGGVGEASSK